MLKRILPMRTALVCLALASAALAADKEWAKGVPFTTDWDKAIKEIKNTGKILLVYNGWEREKV
jgi:hypothetical protein